MSPGRKIAFPSGKEFINIGEILTKSKSRGKDNGSEVGLFNMTI